MGRSKQAPIRRVSPVEDEVLGRSVLPADESLERSWTAEIVGNETEEEEDLPPPQRRRRPAMEDSSFAGTGERPPARSSRKPSTSGSRRSLRELFAEAEEAESETLAATRQRRKAKVKAKVKKRVQFPPSLVVATTIEPPELHFSEQLDEEQKKSQAARTILYQRRLPSTASSSLGTAGDSSRATVVLCVFPLLNTRVEFVESESMAEKESDKKMPSRLPITTALGAMDIWRYGDLPGNITAGNAIGCAVDDGTLLLELSIIGDKAVELRVSCTEEAFKVCHPTELPLKRRVTAKRYQKALGVHAALAALFPDSIVADTGVVVKAGAAPPPPVTAKQVYALTDNVQLQRAMKDESSQQSLKIKGLVPTLRPYQAAAVQWMLRRERQSGLAGTEWELAWVVIHMNQDQESVIIPLPEWTDRENTNVLLVCPFAGWMVGSYEEARSLLSESMIESPKGGILAESMGLGKTVEVLACILANPRPKLNVTVQRKLEFEDEASDTVEEGAQHGVETPRIGIVDDLGDFGDADDSADEENDLLDRVDLSTSSGSALLTVSRAEQQTRPVPITPEKAEVIDTYKDAEERWIDEDLTLGSCICGTVVAWSDLKDDSPVIVCETCEEPMHNECAGFASRKEMEAQTMPLLYRRMFSDAKRKARLAGSDICPCCVVRNKSLLPSRATLIITPPAILSQWEREVQRHTLLSDGKPLRVLVYHGVERLCKGSDKRKRDRNELMKLLHPRYLADADVVLMTFDALMSDLGHSDDNRFITGKSGDGSGNNLRKRKRYRVVPSPLTSIRWWRVCLDEAQRVETPTAGSAQMALKLEADHRWAVSGTPIGRGKLEDLFGLLLFLRLDPFSDKPWFSKCFGSFRRLINVRIHHLLKEIFWRSTKSLGTVREQMGVPEQIETKVLLRFSSIEKHFYKRQLEHTLAAAGDFADRVKAGKKRKASHMDVLAEHLHRLRAACCHPQVGASGIGRSKKHRVSGKKSADGSTISVSSRVMSMDQILDRFIDDSKLKCEESQRLVLLHTNGMASLSKLKVEAKERGVNTTECDTTLFSKSCKLYLESLELGEENATPTLVVGEAILTGIAGFQSSQKIVRDGKCFLDWKLSGSASKEVWSRIDFEGPSRRVTQVRVRSTLGLPQEISDEISVDFQWRLMHPKDCAFQVSSAAVGGEFVDVATFSLGAPDAATTTNNWHCESGFRTNKSKNWRLVIKNYHETDTIENQEANDSDSSTGMYIGIELELLEADIASDPLQRLHCLHNASLAFTSLLQLHESGSNKEEYDETTFLPFTEMRSRVDLMGKEATKIETLYLDGARGIHTECYRRLKESSEHRKRQEKELFDLSDGVKEEVDSDDVWDDGWFDDFLVLCRFHGTETQQRDVCERLLLDLDGVLGGALEGTMQNDVPLPEFGDINGLRTVLKMRIESIRNGLGKEKSRRSRTTAQVVADSEAYGASAHIREGRFKCPPGAHRKCIQSISQLSTHPSEGEVFENSHCRVCKADWNQAGPKCRHCKIGDVLDELSPDRVTLLALHSLSNIVRSQLGAAIIRSSKSNMSIDNRAIKFFAVLEGEKREKLVASRLWRIHLDLLNDVDELNQCKSTMRLSYDEEDLTQLMDDQLNAIVVPMDVNARYHDHAAKQAMALGDLRRAKDTLRYLKNQSTERMESADQEGEEEHCVVCLSELKGDRAVLRCGHSFHYSPCLEQLQARSGNSAICCPMRCKVRTIPDEVMIASEKRGDDGSRIKRQVKGSWGTKVTQLVADVMDVCDLGEKSIVFSQWEDMLDIAEEALVSNGVKYVRATSLQRIGECTKQFRSQDCSVLLLNIKSGAEGLTILEATHVFMIEPLLNCGLDSQGKKK